MNDALRQIRFPLILLTCFSLAFPPELIAQAFDKTEYKEYDELGRRTAKTDQAERTRWFEYDKAGSLTAAILTAVNDPCNGDTLTYPRTEYKHDIYGNLIELWTNVKESPDTGYIDDSAKRVTKFAYDHLQNQISRILPNGKTEYKEYDQYSRITKITDFNEHVTTFVYNDTNNPGLLEEQRHYINDSYYTGNPDDPNLEIHISYDELGRKTVVDVNDEGVESAYGYHYDAEGRIYQIDSPQGYVRYEFSDITGQKTEVRTPAVDADTQISYTYDALGRLASVQVNKRNNVTPSNEITAYAYNTVGSLAKITYSNGNTANYTYDNLNRLTNLVHKNSGQTTLASYAYTLAADGKRTSVTELDGTVINWEYDALNRLVTEDYNAPGDANDFTHTYVYDLVGNRLQKQVTDGNDTVYSYNPDTDELEYEITDSNSITYGYDDNGSLIQKDDGLVITDYTYNLQNRLSSVDDGTSVVSYEYDTDGVRVQKSIAGGATTNYLIDHYNHTGYPQVFKESTGSSQTAYIIGSDVISQSTGTDDPQYLLRDGHGSVRAAVDSSGVITGSYHFDAYGQLLAHSDTPSTSILYAGQMWDDEISLYNNWHRWYSPLTGLFNQIDPYEGDSEDPLSLHKYLYAHADPINNFDPSGEFSLTEINVTAAIQATMMAMNVTGALYHAKQMGVSVVGLWNAWAMGDFWGGLPHVVMGAIHGGGLVMNIAGMIGSMTPPPSASMSALVLSGSGAVATERFWTVVISNPQMAGWVIKSIAPPAFSAYIAFQSRSGGCSAESHHKISPETEKYDFKNHKLVKKAGWTEETLKKNPRNQMLLDNHHGRHVDSYHKAIKQMLDDANKGVRGKNEAIRVLNKVLDKIEQDIVNGTLKPYKTKDVYIP